MEVLGFIKSQVTIPEKQIHNTLELLSNDATIPFIARYRKEVTGNLSEVEIEKIALLAGSFHELQKRKAAVLKAIEEQGMLDETLQKKIEAANSLTMVEDLYLPFKKKRKTKADTARENGLEPLAKIIMAQNSADVRIAAKNFKTAKIKTEEDALEGAKHIIAEWINENELVRKKLRELYRRSTALTTKRIKSEENNPSAQVYKQYFDWSEPLKKMPSHRFLAIYRAEKEKYIRIKAEADKDQALDIISRVFIKSRESASKVLILEAIEDAYKRLLQPSFSNEILSEAKKKADDSAIGVFADNLEQLLLAPPLGEKRIMAIDPGFKSGCKVVCLGESGKLLHNENIYPHPPQKEFTTALKKVRSLVNAYNIEAISIGNGTASRETESFIKKVGFDRDVEVFIVNEAGASVYSASKIARAEFPDYDITVRGAVSIGRRLSDPLAELVKIDPKSIGVGQYQHEVDQVKLKEKLDSVVMSCVNRIGVNVNTASKELLAYVSGIGPAIAENIIGYREKKGNLKSKADLMKIPRLGAKAFEQSAGFLRIKNGKNPLDDSAVHPESYGIVNKIARDENLKISDLIGNSAVLKNIPLEKYRSDAVGLPTLTDIIEELEKPGVDPRKKLKPFEFDPSVKKIEDLHAGMRLPGIVNNITNFGCFVDLGIKENGLIHISKMAREYVSDISSVVKLNQAIEVTVIDIDLEQKRIQLSLID